VKIESITRNHRIGGRMVMVKRPAHRKGVSGYQVGLEGGRDQFIAAGTEVENVTTGGTTRTRSRR
jgi:hypothetical protein